MARIYRRGKYWYVDYVNLLGERVRKSLGTTSKKLAELKLKEIEVELAKGRLGFATDVKLEEFIEEYLNWSKVNKSKNTYDVEKRTAKRILKFFGNVKMSQITPNRVEAFKMWLVQSEGLSKVSANVLLRHFKAMMNKALEWNFLEKSPVEKLKLYTVPKGRPDFLTEQQIAEFFSVVENPTHLAIFYLLYLTGMRLSEATHLTWDDVNFEDEYIRIRSKGIWHTKNYRERVVPIHKKLLPHLKHLKEISPEKVVPYSNRRIQELMKIYSIKSGIKVTPHLLRHSIATAMASKGVSLQAIKEILGHSDYSTTLIYAKMTDEYKKKAIEAVFNEEEMAQFRHN